MQPTGSLVSSAVRNAGRGEHDASVRIVGTGVALGLLALAAIVFEPRFARSAKRSRIPYLKADR